MKKKSSESRKISELFVFSSITKWMFDELGQEANRGGGQIDGEHQGFSNNFLWNNWPDFVSVAETTL
jgi:hypothetical protein